MRLGPKITETVKGKLSLGARILQVGGVEKIFKQLFSVREGEKLLKASQCYLSTTAGPIAGLLFISMDKIAFCSEKSIKFSSPNGELIRARYKVIFQEALECLNISICIFLYNMVLTFWVICLFPGCDPSKQDKGNQPKWECKETITKVHRDSNSWQLWLLVYGFLELPESFQVSSTDKFSILEKRFRKIPKRTYCT